jgi:hypothetical protein
VKNSSAVFGSPWARRTSVTARAIAASSDSRGDRFPESSIEHGIFRYGRHLEPLLSHVCVRLRVVEERARHPYRREAAVAEHPAPTLPLLRQRGRGEERLAVDAQHVLEREV